MIIFINFLITSFKAIVSRNIGKNLNFNRCYMEIYFES